MSPEYLMLFSAVSNTIEQLDALKQELIVAQQRAEEAYISSEEE